MQVRRSDRAAQLQTPVGGVHPGATSLDLDRREERAHAALENLLDGTRPTAAGIARGPHAQTIAVHHATHLGRRQEHTLLQSLDAQESVAGAIRAHDAFDRGSRLEAGTRSPRARMRFVAGAAVAASRRARAVLCLRAVGAAVRFRAMSLGRTPLAAIASPGLSSTRLQLTVPGPVRTFRGLPAPARVAELVDALVSGTSAARRGGSSPLLGTRYPPYH